MSDHKPPPAKVPDGVTPYVTTRQMPPNEKGFVGFETIWKPFQKEANTRRRRSLRRDGRESTGHIAARYSHMRTLSEDNARPAFIIRRRTMRDPRWNT